MADVPTERAQIVFPEHDGEHGSEIRDAFVCGSALLAINLDVIAALNAGGTVAGGLPIYIKYRKCVVAVTVNQ